jgi:hypothetical protein
MIIKYIDPNSQALTIKTVQGVSLDKADDEDGYKYVMLFPCEQLFCIIAIYMDSYSHACEYLNKIYDDGKADFSTDPDIIVEVESIEYNQMPDFMSELFDNLDDEDFDGVGYDDLE